MTVPQHFGAGATDEAAAQERRRIEFQKTLGAGTSDYTGR